MLASALLAASGVVLPAAAQAVPTQALAAQVLAEATAVKQALAGQAPGAQAPATPSLSGQAAAAQAQTRVEGPGGTVDTTGRPVAPRVLPGPAGSEAPGPVEGGPHDPGATDAGEARSASTVIGAALAFIAPRSLDATTIPQLAVWGLQVLPTLDPALVLRLAEGTIELQAASGHAPAPRSAPSPGVATAPGGTVAPGGAASPPGGAAPGIAAAAADARAGAERTDQADGSLHAVAPDPADPGAAGERFVRAAPPAGDAQAWGELTAAAMGWASQHSAAVRATGGPALLQGFFDEVFSHLDPYSRYVPPAGAQHVRDRLAGQVGIGVELSRLGANLVLTTVAANGPAAEAGLRAGERLLSVDGQSTGDDDVAAVAARLVGEEDSMVTLRVAGPDGRARSLTLRRAVVPPETVFAERQPLGPGRAAGEMLVLRITAFTADTAERLSQELEDGLDARSPRVTRGLVLDLRGDRGGLLRQAVTAVALLLNQGVVATTVGRAPEASRVWRVQGGDLTQGLPIVVLVDGRTASASEIMAAALADQGRAVVVGSATLGKGVVQTLTELPNGGEVFVTWSRVLAPLGWPIQGLGVLPQLCTSLGREATARQLRRLSQGVLEMAGALASWHAARAPLDPPVPSQMREACPAAEGRDGDMEAARVLLGHPRAYAAALLPVPGLGLAPPPLGGTR